MVDLLVLVLRGTCFGTAAQKKAGSYIYTHVFLFVFLDPARHITGFPSQRQSGLVVLVAESCISGGAGLRV